MLSLVRANAAGLEHRFKVITLVCVLFIDRCSSTNEQRHHAVPPYLPRNFSYVVCLKLVSYYGLVYRAVTRERIEREGSKKKEYDSVADEWVHQRVTESESDDDSVEALTVRTPLQ